MRISRQSKFVRWCWYWDGVDAPDRTSICALFWRGFVLMPAGILIVSWAVLYILYLIVITPTALWLLGGTAAAVAVPIWAIKMKRRRWRPVQHKQQSVVLTVLIERAKAVKQKACPLVELY